MMKNHLFYKTLLIGSLAGLLTACMTANRPLDPGAEQVKVITTAAPQDCQLVGEVGSADENGRSHSYTSHEHLETDQTNVLRNQALKLGANLVVLTQHQALSSKQSTPAPQGKFRGGSKITVMNYHGMAGEAYTCPITVINQLP